MTEHTTLSAELSQNDDGSEGELMIDLDLPDNFGYDVDDIDGEIIVQYWKED